MKLLISALLLLFACITEAKKIVTLDSPEYPPYTSEEMESEGFITQIIIETFKQVGYEARIQYFPWARIVKRVEEGKVMGVTNIWQRVERMNWVIYSDPMPGSELVFYKLKSKDISFKGNYRKLRSYTIGTGASYANPPAFDAVKDTLNVKFNSEDIKNLKMLSVGRLDLVIFDKYLAAYLMKKHMPEALEKLDFINYPLSIEQSRLGISKKTENANQIIVDFNRGLAQLKREGRVRAILKAHSMPVAKD